MIHCIATGGGQTNKYITECMLRPPELGYLYTAAADWDYGWVGE